jgi:hypothetical protein
MTGRVEPRGACASRRGATRGHGQHAKMTKVAVASDWAPPGGGRTGPRPGAQALEVKRPRASKQISSPSKMA